MINALQNGNYSVTDSNGFSQQITQDQQEILNQEIQDAFKTIDEAKDSKNTKAAETKESEIKAANELLTQAQSELEEAKTQADLYDYDAQGFFGAKGKFDYSDMSANDAAQMYNDAYYGVDKDGDGEIDTDSVNYSSLNYDSVSDDELETLETILAKDPGDWSPSDMKTVDGLMEKMASEAKNDTAETAKQENKEYKAAKKENEASINKAEQKYTDAVEQNNSNAEAQKEAKESEIIDNAVFGIGQEGAKAYFEELAKD